MAAVRAWLVVPAAVLLAACSLPGQGGGTAPSASPRAASPSPSPSSFLQAIWVLSPIGLNLREGPDRTAKFLATVLQGTQLTATAFSPGDPGWHQVQYQ